jgi:hypothetical protein
MMVIPAICQHDISVVTYPKKVEYASWCTMRNQIAVGAVLVLATLMLFVFAAIAGVPKVCIEAESVREAREQIRLYTLCIESGKLKKKDLARSYYNRGINYHERGEL